MENLLEQFAESISKLLKDRSELELRLRICQKQRDDLIRDSANTVNGVSFIYDPELVIDNFNKAIDKQASGGHDLLPQKPAVIRGGK